MKRPMLLALITTAIIAGLATMPARADVIYTYTGNDFTNTFSPYNTNDSITGYFTVSQPLGDNLSEESISPLAFSFTDTVDTVTNSDSYSQEILYISTNAEGDISGWEISLILSGSNVRIQTSDAYGESLDSVADSSGAYGSISSDPGTWAVSTPEPSAALLLGTALLGLMCVYRRRKNLHPSQ